MVDEPAPGPRSYKALAAFLLACLAVFAAGGRVTATSVGGWYQTLAKPPFNPPDWVFGPVWGVLFVMIAVSGWRAWCASAPPLRARVTALYAFQLTFNLAWSYAFFGMQSIVSGLFVIGVLLAAIAANAVVFFRLDRWAGALLLPYLGWVGFAAFLNATLWQLNPG